MENTDGEPDVTGYDEMADNVTFCDCSPESPNGGGAFVMTAKLWTHAKRTSQAVTP